VNNLDIKYNDGMYEILVEKEKDTLSIGVNNVMKCKQIFLQQMSRKFDEAVNKKLGDYGFITDND